MISTLSPGLTLQSFRITTDAVFPNSKSNIEGIKIIPQKII